MKFVHFVEDGKRGLALETADGSLRGLAEDEAAYPGGLDALVRSGAFAPAAAALSEGRTLDPSRISYDLPFRRAGKILCVGLNYRDHAEETKFEVPEFPTVFVRFNSNIVPHGSAIVRPNVSSMLDYEGELAAVIGKAGRAIAPERALEHVAGYCIFNDVSVRDYQFKSPQWTIGKNFDNTGSMGPSFVTADELPAGARGLVIETRLNNEVVQKATTSDLIFTVETLVSLLSTGMTLEPGDIIVTGTPSGVGMAMEPQLFMKPGDVCEVEVERVGVLRNPVVAEAA